MVYLLQLGIWDLEFHLGILYSQYFIDLKDFQDIYEHNSTETNPKREILGQPIIFSANDALNYRKYWEKSLRWNKSLR